eukprot:gene31467-6654_t
MQGNTQPTPDQQHLQSNIQPTPEQHLKSMQPNLEQPPLQGSLQATMEPEPLQGNIQPIPEQPPPQRSIQPTPQQPPLHRSMLSKVMQHLQSIQPAMEQQPMQGNMQPSPEQPPLQGNIQPTPEQPPLQRSMLSKVMQHLQSIQPAMEQQPMQGNIQPTPEQPPMQGRMMSKAKQHLQSILPKDGIGAWLHSFLLSVEFQAALQLTVGAFVASLFVFVDSMSFGNSCLIITLYLIMSILVPAYCYVGAKLLATCLVFGSTVIGSVLAGGLASIAKATDFSAYGSDHNHSASTALYMLLASAGLALLCINRVAAGPPYLHGMAVLSSLLFGITMMGAQNAPPAGQEEHPINWMWKNVVGYNLLSAAIAAGCSITSALLVLPTCAVDELRWKLVDVLGGESTSPRPSPPMPPMHHVPPNGYSGTTMQLPPGYSGTTMQLPPGYNGTTMQHVPPHSYNGTTMQLPPGYNGTTMQHVPPHSYNGTTMQLPPGYNGTTMQHVYPHGSLAAPPMPPMGDGFPNGFHTQAQQMEKLAQGQHDRYDRYDRQGGEEQMGAVGGEGYAHDIDDHEMNVQMFLDMMRQATAPIEELKHDRHWHRGHSSHMSLTRLTSSISQHFKHHHREERGMKMTNNESSAALSLAGEPRAPLHNTLAGDIQSDTDSFSGTGGTGGTSEANGMPFIQSRFLAQASHSGTGGTGNPYGQNRRPLKPSQSSAHLSSTCTVRGFHRLRGTIKRFPPVSRTVSESARAPNQPR